MQKLYVYLNPTRGPPQAQNPCLKRMGGLRGHIHVTPLVAGELIVDGPATGACNSRAMGSIPTPVSFPIVSFGRVVVNCVDNSNQLL